ncbi:MAG TPA: fatty acid cis/trans isomerase [Polyangiaceae bacterium]|nr:fatty acid cis/trans isomerase [Polyangiaceae bacterium]
MSSSLRPAYVPPAAFLLIAGVLAAIAACATPRAATLSMPLRVDYELLDSLPAQPIDYESQVRPILESRCVVCHGCYDAPCQLKLSAYEGIARGGSKEVVYDGARISAADPTRLFIDALTTAEWRKKGFHAVLDEAAKNPYQRLDGSVLYRMLRLKQLHPQPLTGRLPPGIDVGLDRKASCPTLAEFDDYASEHPQQGMPFALPNLEPEQYQTLVHWLAQGAPRSAAEVLDASVAEQVATWEHFLNGQSLKERLVARYLYEHLFLGSLHFSGQSPRSFFQLVRSSTPPGQPIVPIATRRPYGDPGGPFFYRLRPQPGSVVAKNHVPYELSPARLEWLHELFFETDYAVAALPSYEPEVASNPFRAFAALPLRSRYGFLLEDARFFIEGFIKGPVCRGQVALNVIEDRFWILFFDPDSPLASNSSYIDQLAEYLAQPIEMEDNLRLVTSYGHYLKLENRYLEARRKAAHLALPLPLDRALGLLWNGGGTNPNAALTVYRHTDSASVDQGLIGEPPETAWFLDYPLLERIHYLLVAGFDVYGNVGHQLNTRLHMDVLRMEAEDHLLAYLPAKVRKTVHDGWYQGIRSGEAEDIVPWWMDVDLVTGYQTDQPQQELYTHLLARLGPLSKSPIPRPCSGRDCDSEARPAALLRADQAFQKLSHMRGKFVEFLPDVAFVRVVLGGAPEADLAYTLLSDKSYDNVSSMFSEQKPGDRRDASGDRQTVLPWLEGSYPEFFFVVPLSEVESFVARYDGIQNRDDYERFTARFGVRRTNPAFWQAADWFNAQALREQPVRAGILDLNRYQDR